MNTNTPYSKKCNVKNVFLFETSPIQYWSPKNKKVKQNMQGNIKSPFERKFYNH